MATNQITPNDYLGFIDEGQGNRLVAAFQLGDAAIPRVGESITLHDEGGKAGATYVVKRILYHYGRRWKTDDSPSLLKVTAYIGG